MKAIKIVKMSVFVLTAFAQLQIALYAAIGLYIFYIDGDDSIPLMAFVIVICYAFFGMAAAVISAVRIMKQKRLAFITGLCMQLWIIITSFGFLMIPAGVPEAAVFIILISSVALAIALILRSMKRKKSGKLAEKSGYIRFRFTIVKAKWNWDATAEEYCNIHYVSKDMLNDSEKRDVTEYAATWIAYFLAWIIKNDLYSEDLAEKLGEETIWQTKNECAAPVQILERLDWCLTREFFNKEILPFIDHYFDMLYFEDYHKVIKSKTGYTYCVDFSWDIYHVIESIIDDRRLIFIIHQEEADVCNELCEISPDKVYFPKMDAELELVLSEGVSDEYAEKCVRHLQTLPENIIDELCEFFCVVMGGEEYIDGSSDKCQILKFYRPDRMIIFKPYGEQAAYVIGGEADFEADHGVAWSVMGDELADVGYRYDIESSSPWVWQKQKLL